MWLFDDILKKPQEKAPVDPLQWDATRGTGSSGWQPPQDDGSTPVIIQKTVETSLFDTTPPVDMSDLRIQEAVQVATPRAEENTDTLLVSIPLDPPPVITEQVTPPEENMHSLFSPTEPSAVIATESAPSFLTETPEQSSSTDSLFSLGKDNAVIESSFFSPVVEVEEKKVEKILHPKEFLERSIESIDSMITDIDTAYDKKVSEAVTYAQEKDRLATLEKDTYEEASKLSEEKTHALHVRKLLDTELWGNTKKGTEELLASESLQGQEEIETPLVSSDVPEALTAETLPTLTDTPVSVKKAHTEKVEEVLPVGV